MKPFYALAVGLLAAFCVNAQINYPGEPWNWSDTHFPGHLSFMEMPALDREALAAEDAVVDQYKEAPWRFGVEHEVQITPYNSGTWTHDEANGRMIWQLAVHCPEGTSMSFLFSRYQLRKGEELFIWSADRTRYLGLFDHRNNAESGVLPVGLIASDRAVIELSVPDTRTEGVELELSQIVHGYRSLLRSDFDPVNEERGPFGNSGACNINVNCPQGADWQVEKRAVALIVSGGSAICSGALVNNTANDGTPYFLTANHCLPNNTSQVANWVFYFNHETAGCTGNTGPTNQSIAGSVLRARNAGSDFALLELNSTPPASFNVQYSGWDKTDLNSSATSAVGIHHPSGDLKKICFEDDAPTKTNQAGAAVWYINEWEEGVTEGGSSGSPLFNQSHRIIGQLYGGFAACAGSVNNGEADWYGRFGVSWDGNSASARLRDWLDPLGLNPNFIDGYPDGFVAANLDAAAGSISGVPASICGSNVNASFTLSNNGAATLTSCTITYQLNGGTQGTINWTGSLAQGQSTSVNIPALNAANGNNTLTINVSSPNGQADQNNANNSVQISFNAIAGPTFNCTLTLNFDNYPDETSWRITQGNTTISSSNGTYGNQPDGSTLQIDLCLAEGCYNLIMEDDYGDGMCCEYGEGSYSLTNNFGQVVASGGEFEDSETTNFCVGGVGVDDLDSSALTVYPNPANDRIQVLNSRGGQVHYELMDMTGRVAMTGQFTGTRHDTGIQGLSNGVYTLRVRGEDWMESIRVMVRH
ncbi:MAG: trypsin-like peptidase domain-containing protein [Flavobacteriales bacterium]